eukprot:TRINITY_DN40727_c0_g1_i1.p1 TRINITY_DN40727_c0_g1~~TRINITY_DN40727_c0_g1_i1.p1  ORF type:complete len:215 (+),score=9.23 TRINITY_DN40727_c0_g1_i1:99-647(+)
MLHRSCISAWTLSQAEEGWLPCRCPILTCRQPMADTFLAVVLTEDELQRYNLLFEKITEWRNVRESRLLTCPRIEEEFRQLGCRMCPNCGAWVEKRADVILGSLLDGCDLVTCRCSTRFCFACGAVDARCQCPGNVGHSFIPHEEVVADYPLLRGAQGVVERIGINGQHEALRDASGNCVIG